MLSEVKQNDPLTSTPADLKTLAAAAATATLMARGYAVLEICAATDYIIER